MGAPESARLLHCSPSFWVEELGKEQAMAAAVNLQFHVVESTNTVPVCYGNEQDVILGDGLGPRSIVVSESGARCLGSSTTRSSGGIVYVGDGVVAPSEQSKHSWTSTSLVMPLLYELQILFSGGPVPSGVNVVIAGTCAFSIILTLIRTL